MMSASEIHFFVNSLRSTFTFLEVDRLDSFEHFMKFFH